MSPKTIMIIVVVFVVAGLKFAAFTPKWHTLAKHTAMIGQGQAYTQQVFIKKNAKAKVSFTAEVPIDFYWLSKADHENLQSGKISDPVSFEMKLTNQTIVANNKSVIDKEFQLPIGECFLYFEPVSPSESGVQRKVSFEVQYFQ